MPNTLVDLCIQPQWLITLDASGAHTQPWLEQHDVWVDQGRICAITQRGQSHHYTAKHTQMLDEHILLPGYINAHGHAAMSLFRGMADDLPLMRWLNEHIWPAESLWVNPQFVRDGTELAMAEMIQSGTTTFADMYFFPETATDAAEQAGMRCVSFSPVLDFPTAYATSPDEYFEKALALYKSKQNSELITIGLGPHAPYTVSDELFSNVATLCKQYNMPVQTHLHETNDEIAQSLDKYGKRPTERLEALALFNHHVSCAHCVHVDQNDIDILARHHTSVVHCPQSNLKLASGFCPTHTLQTAGVNVAIGTDGAASNNDLNLQSEMQTAALLAKAVAGNAEAMPAYQALQSATLGGARALGLADVTGSIQVGKWADLQAVKISGIAQTPMYDPISHVVYTNSSQQTEHVWIGGKHVLREGQLTTLNEQDIQQRAMQWAKRIREHAKQIAQP